MSIDLMQRSIAIIKDNQNPSGAYLASPNFPTYHYCWFRDGAFSAYAMDVVGEHTSAGRFHHWAASTILTHAASAREAIRLARAGQPLPSTHILHTRYRLDGSIDEVEDWPNFQLDGFGTWLWALAEHVRLAGSELPDAWRRAAMLVATYLSTLWHLPCYDCWEEHPEERHTYTLAAIFAGLRAAGTLTGLDYNPVMADIRADLLKHAVQDGYFTKYIGTKEVDANLLALAVPYEILSPDDALVRATVANIEINLNTGGGLHRYAADTYYGGGQWVLLTAWLGWYYLAIDQKQTAREILSWVEAQGDDNGQLPEQVPIALNNPALYETWRQRWGEIAKPLLWSHAMYLILKSGLQAS